MIFISLTDCEGKTLFENSIKYGYISTVKMFFEYDSSLMNKPIRNGKTPVYLAAKWGKTELLKYLLTLPNIKIDFVADNGNTPLEAAYLNKHQECADLLSKANIARKNVVKRMLFRLFKFNKNNNSNNKDTPICCF